MKITAKDILKPALILFVICLVVTALLAGTNLLTKDKIAEQSALEAEQSRKVVLSDADSFEEADGYYIGKANNETVGYVFQTEAKGYGGAVKVMTGISADGQITGVVILEHSETPGLGANAEKASFTEQFKQTAPPCANTAQSTSATAWRQSTPQSAAAAQNAPLHVRRGSSALCR